jgi:hypothetical protein
MFKTDEFRSSYNKALSAYRLLTDGQRAGIRQVYLDKEREWIKQIPLLDTTEYDEIMQAQDLMDKLAP